MCDPSQLVGEAEGKKESTEAIPLSDSHVFVSLLHVSNIFINALDSLLFGHS